MFLDESGRSADPRDPYFALAGVAISAEEALSYRARADRLKQLHFGTSDITFHEPMMRQGDGPFYFEGDAGRRQAFHADLDELVRGTEFVAFGAGIRRVALERFWDVSGHASGRGAGAK